MSLTDFERRKYEIFEAIVEAYLETASPVGSEFISRMLHNSLSSATIRHVMVDLEKAGLVEQPHTSAGRVPTDRGYRFYVDALVDGIRLSEVETQRLMSLMQPQDVELDRLFERISGVLAQETQHASVVLAPTVKQSRVRQIELLPLGANKLLCVLVAQETMVASHVVEIREPISREEGFSLAQFLNAELVGLPMQELLPLLEQRLLEVERSMAPLVKRSIAILQTVLATEPEERLLLEGALYLVDEPEFRGDPGKTHRLLRQLELRKALMAKMREDLTGSQTRVRIGSEVGIEGLEDCSYILAPFSVRQNIVGGVGVLGPKRMDYRRTRAVVEATADLVTDWLTQWELNA